MFYSCSAVGAVDTLSLGSVAVAMGYALLASSGATSVLIP